MHANPPRLPALVPESSGVALDNLHHPVSLTRDRAYSMGHLLLQPFMSAGKGGLYEECSLRRRGVGSVRNEWSAAPGHQCSRT